MSMNRSGRRTQIVEKSSTCMVEWNGGPTHYCTICTPPKQVLSL